MGVEHGDRFREQPVRARTDPMPARRGTARAFGRSVLRVTVASVVATLAICVVPVLTGHAGDPATRRSEGPYPPRIVELEPVFIDATPELIAPARAVTTWSVADRRFGRITVYVRPGESPLEVLKTAVLRRGFIPVVRGLRSA